MNPARASAVVLSTNVSSISATISSTSKQYLGLDRCLIHSLTNRFTAEDSIMTVFNISLIAFNTLCTNDSASATARHSRSHSIKFKCVLSRSKKQAENQRLEEEKAKNQAKAELVAQKKAELAAAEAAKQAEEAATEEAAAE